MKTSLALRKLHSKAGETIAETLVALLISALALVMLAGAISTTAKVITKSDDVMTNYYAGDAALVEQSGAEIITVNIGEGEGATATTIETRSVKFTENAAFASKSVVAYKTAPDTP